MDMPRAPARRQLLDLLKMGGPQPADALAQQLNVTPMAVRQHMYELEKEELVQSTTQPSGRGRPKRLWALTEQAMQVFPDAHQGLAVELIRAVENLFGPEGLEKVADRHASQQRDTYAKALEDVHTTRDRLGLLAEQRTLEGYMATVMEDHDGFLFIENHCPICSAARACTRLCANELDVFRAMLGPHVSITREEHIITGARRCAYRIRENT